MTCAEFQRDLPYIIEGGGSAVHDEHLRTCAVCSDLVNDLRYIAEQAKLLVPMIDPSPRVWDGISKSLEREGLVKPAPVRRGLLGPQRWSWGWVTPLAAVVLIATAAIFFALRSPGPAEGSESASVTDEAQDPVDGEVLQAVADRDPVFRQSYEDNLKRVNAYIRDAKRTLDDNPGDEEARHYLMQAYEQKNLLYQMATRSGE